MIFRADEHFVPFLKKMGRLGLGALSSGSSILYFGLFINLNH